jgi:hypothetical protein
MEAVMRTPELACIILLGTAALPFAACAAVPVSDKASNITPKNIRSTIAPALPVPPLDDDARPIDYLKAAQEALTHGRTGEAQEALERAEARALDRAVPLLQTSTPIGDPLVTQIRAARLALGSNDPARAARLIAAATDTASYLASSQ